MIRRVAVSTLVLGALAVVASDLSAADDLKPISQRFAVAKPAEVPDFQRHLVPLMGKLSCNGRACHGSFQGQGDFRLSLFGYDFKMDHDGLSERIDTDAPRDSYALQKATLSEPHRGGKRMEVDSWQYKVFLRWIEGGAKPVAEKRAALTRLEITPSEIVFQSKGQEIQLKAVAVWSDGTREDVTPLCRFKSNDDQICEVTANGNLTAGNPGDSHVVAFYDYAVVATPVMRPVSDQVGMKYPAVSTPTRVDELVVEKLRKMGVVPSDLCTDAEYLRRVSLDLIGTLPKPKDVEAFVASKDANKRAKKVDELLESSAYAAWWTTKLCDFTGNNDDQLNNVSPVRGRTSEEWYGWIEKRVANNVPYDELVAGIVTATSRAPKQSYLDYCKEMSSIYRDDSKKSFADLHSMPYYWARRDFRELEARAIGFAYSFLGIRIQCAQCHKHPFDQWSTDDFHKFKNFFSRVNYANRGSDPKEYAKLLKDLGLDGKNGGNLRRELPTLLNQGKTIPFPELVVSARPVRSRNNEYPTFTGAKLLAGQEYDITKVEDPRTLVMDWLRAKDNPLFARAFVNRVWASYFNVGIVEPADDNSLANPPSNKPLLDFLSEGFVKSGFDMKWVHRTIANSATYQRSWRANETNKTDERNFSRSIPRRLPAEVAFDALKFATASDSELEKMHSGTDGRSIALAAAGARASRTQYALGVFGRSTRDSNCDCDRSSEPSLLQTVFLQNDQEVMRMVDASRTSWVGQVAAEINPKRARATNNTQGGNGNGNQATRIRKQLTTAMQAVEKAKKAGNDKLVDTTQKRVKALRAQLQKVAPAAAPQNKAAGEKVEVAEARIQDFVKQTYLRALSRYPSVDELSRSQQYIQQADDTVDGVRDLLWALLNTKEFIVNH
ncbi:MAG: DUF1549 domain-containing protein [Planctomycetota bacterium]|nr:DUF1549 domain-containing protein [Planctomycetota bacterium]